MTATSTHRSLSFDSAVKLRIAIADQQHTFNRLAATTPSQSTVVAPADWVSAVGQRLLKGLGDGSIRICPHLGPRRGFGPMFCVLQTSPKIECKACFSTARSRLNPIEGVTCDRCSVYARGLISGAMPIGPLLLIFGLCRSCAVETGVAGRGPE